MAAAEAAPRDAHLSRVLGADTLAKVRSSRVFVCGAGGIGCELLKNLVLSGFADLEVIDLDTIDASNLNRQFLFRPPHVGKSKAEVARQSALGFNPSVKIVAHLGNVKDTKFDKEFYERFDIVLNGLDNRSARQHVNRMCMKANVPLIESGTMGYNGQVWPIVKNLTECYDCHPKPAQQVSYAVCTIHQRPTSMVHCVHYAKEFHKRFFGEPGDRDPEMQFLDEIRAAGAAEGPAVWVPRVFDAIFDAKVKELLEVPHAAWPEGKEPRQLTYAAAAALVEHPDGPEAPIAAKRVLSVAELAADFVDSFRQLLDRQAAEGQVPFDKDDQLTMKLVSAVANLRAWNFRIPLQSGFDIKTIAGNIIPAIATSNAIAAGMIVLEAVKILTGRRDALRNQYLQRNPSVTGRRAGRCDNYLVPVPPQRPNPRCYVCQAGSNQLALTLNISQTTVRFVVATISAGELSMAHPMVSLCRANTEKLIYEDEEHEGFADKPLSTWIPIEDPQGWSLKVEDMLQELEAELLLRHSAAMGRGDYQLAGDVRAVAMARAGGAAATPDDDDEDEGVCVSYHPSKGAAKRRRDAQAESSRTPSKAARQASPRGAVASPSQQARLLSPRPSSPTARMLSPRGVASPSQLRGAIAGCGAGVMPQ
eukprot:TRINITY_DN60007_c0_g1_i1.p1 TRINITY_DN60007_c0_g1~~TRINITY_DN60007_c0_g1_i1.p1  ORF type:complete len:647 (+),score=209.17 TRINITY_DN60007_c0_g1_i1:67-2007(+)